MSYIILIIDILKINILKICYNFFPILIINSNNGQSSLAFGSEKKNCNLYLSINHLNYHKV